MASSGESKIESKTELVEVKPRCSHRPGFTLDGVRRCICGERERLIKEINIAEMKAMELLMQSGVL